MREASAPFLFAFSLLLHLPELLNVPQLVPIAAVNTLHLRSWGFQELKSWGGGCRAAHVRSSRPQRSPRTLCGAPCASWLSAATGIGPAVSRAPLPKLLSTLPSSAPQIDSAHGFRSEGGSLTTQLAQKHGVDEAEPATTAAGSARPLATPRAPHRCCRTPPRR